MEFTEWTHKYLKTLGSLAAVLDEKQKTLQDMMEEKDKIHSLDIKELSDRIDKLEKTCSPQ